MITSNNIEPCLVLVTLNNSSEFSQHSLSCPVKGQNRCMSRVDKMTSESLYESFIKHHVLVKQNKRCVRVDKGR